MLRNTVEEEIRLHHDCRDVEVVAVKPSTPVPAVPLFLDPFAHYIVFISAMSKIP